MKPKSFQQFESKHNISPYSSLSKMWDSLEDITGDILFPVCIALLAWGLLGLQISGVLESFFESFSQFIGLN